MTKSEFTLTDDYIELFKLLKVEALVASGGEAKYVISEQLVKVNGEVELRKAYKCRKDDVVEFQENQITVR